MENLINPVDPALNAAIQVMANITNPSGWDVIPTFEEAPTSLAALLDYADAHGRLGVAAQDAHGQIYDDAGIVEALRAWHDSIHYRWHFTFTVSGEAAATYAHIGQLHTKYGDTPNTRRWAELIMGDILGLVLYFHVTEEWPDRKRAFTLYQAKKWSSEASRLMDYLSSDHGYCDSEVAAIYRARSKWGNPYEGGTRA